MNKTVFKLYIILIIALLLPGCSLKKNTAAVRKYRAFTTKYNIYFNGNEAYKEALKSFEDNYEDNYSEIVHMHPVGSLADKEPAANAGFDRAIEKSQKAIKLRSINKRPARNPRKANDPEYKQFLKRGEFNPFLHNAWMLMGKSQFYKGDFLAAYSTFLYITRHFSWLPETVLESQLWMARCYTELGWLYEAENVLSKIKDVPPSLTALYNTTMAGLLVKKEDFKATPQYLEIAIKNEKNKAQKARMKFLLAQIYAENGENAKAYKYYGDVIRMNPNYRTLFNASIKQTEVMPTTDSKKIDKKLNKMLRDSRNNEYLDQIYYAKGNLYLSQKDTLKAIDAYDNAVSKSTRNGIEKGVAAISLGDLCFEKENYIKAQPAFSAAVSIIPKEHKEYERVNHISSVLDNLMTHAESVHMQDSLLTLAEMPEDQRMVAIQKIIDDVIKKEKEEAEAQRKEEYEQRKGEITTPAGADMAATNQTINNDNSWYFFNKITVSNGKNDFQRKWGARKPEDNWRRKDKSQIFTEEVIDDLAENDDNSEEVLNADEPGDTSSENGGPYGKDRNMPKERPLGPKDIQYYVDQLPLTDEEKENANNIIREGLFNMAVIFNQQLNNLPLSIKTFLDLDNRYPNSEQQQDIYYEVYLMYMRMDKPELAEVYKQKLLNQYPESPYSVALKNPDYIKNLMEMDQKQNELYEETYAAYLEGNSAQVHRNYEFVMEKWPLSKLMPQFLFLHALSYVNENNQEAFKDNLEKLTALYAESQPAPLASLMIKGITEGRFIAQDAQAMRGMIWNTKLLISGDSTMVAMDENSRFDINYNSPHLLVLAFATDSIDANQMLFDIAKYNFTNYLVKDFDIEIATFNELSMLIIKGFNNFEDLANYRLRMSLPNGLKLPEGVTPVMISEDNFRLLLQGRTFDDYFSFMEESADAATEEKLEEEQ